MVVDEFGIIFLLTKAAKSSKNSEKLYEELIWYWLIRGSERRRGYYCKNIIHEVNVQIQNLLFGDLQNSTARRLLILREGFDPQLESIAFDIYTGWLLTRKAQAHLAISLNYC